MPPVGPSPAIMHVANLKKLVPLWFELSVKMKADREADGAFGWMLEMHSGCRRTLTLTPTLTPTPTPTLIPTPTPSPTLSL